jgi:hypothetical protein
LAASVTSSGYDLMLELLAASTASLSTERAEAATITPAAANCLAVSAPMPVLAPVIQTTRQGKATC